MILLNVRSNIKKKNFNYIFNLFLFFYLIFGFYLSVNTGITADELIEQDNWRNNLEAIKGFFSSNNDGYYTVTSTVDNETVIFVQKNLKRKFRL